MREWISKLIASKKADDETIRRQQGEWIQKQIRAWQLAWHDIYDSDEKLKENPADYGREDPIPENLDSDYRLNFGLAHTEEKTRKACFALLPNGKEMHRRFDEYLTSKRETISKEEALDLLAQLIARMPAAKPNETIDWEKTKIIDSDDDAINGILMQSDHLSVLFESNNLKPTPKKELPALAASSFLSEALYYSAGNYYDVDWWVTSAMFAPERSKVYELNYKLWKGGWNLLLASDGAVLLNDGDAK